MCGTSNKGVDLAHALYLRILVTKPLKKSTLVLMRLFFFNFFFFSNLCTDVRGEYIVYIGRHN